MKPTRQVIRATAVAIAATAVVGGVAAAADATGSTRPPNLQKSLAQLVAAGAPGAIPAACQLILLEPELQDRRTNHRGDHQQTARKRTAPPRLFAPSPACDELPAHAAHPGPVRARLLPARPTSRDRRQRAQPL